MNREFPFDEFVYCDTCDNLGAYDIYGDYLCDDCLEQVHNSLEVA